MGSLAPKSGCERARAGMAGFWIKQVDGASHSRLRRIGPACRGLWNKLQEATLTRCLTRESSGMKPVSRIFWRKMTPSRPALWILHLRWRRLMKAPTKPRTLAYHLRGSSKGKAHLCQAQGEAAAAAGREADDPRSGARYAAGVRSRESEATGAVRCTYIGANYGFLAGYLTSATKVPGADFESWPTCSCFAGARTCCRSRLWCLGDEAFDLARCSRLLICSQLESKLRLVC